MRIAFSFAVAALVACGGESSDRATTSAPARQPPRSLANQQVEKVESTDQQKLSAMLHSYWVWPEDGDPARDLEADHSACVEQVSGGAAKKRRRQSFGFLVRQIQCLQEKGWVQREQ
jgi:hypothetical protein